MNSYGYDRRRICCCRCNRSSTQHEMFADSSHPSLLYKILEAKLFDCLRTNQRSFFTSVVKDEKTPSDSPHLMTTTETVSSIDPVPSKHMLDVNDYEKATLAVPKSKKRKSKKKRKP